MATNDIYERFKNIYLPALCDALYELGIPEQLMPPSLVPLSPDQSFAGAAYCVAGREIDPPIPWKEGAERMRPYLEMFERLPQSSVLVSSTLGSFVGHFGELTANAAVKRGCNGVVLDGNLRDVSGLRETGLPVVYRGLCSRSGIGRWEMEAEQEPLLIGDVTVAPGDVVVGQFEGVLVIPRGDAQQVLERAEAIVAAEDRVRAEIQRGLSPANSFDRHGHI